MNELTDREENAPSRTVCVTGVTGFVGGHIVRRLLLAGHKVHGTCRDPSNKDKTQYLLTSSNASTNLILFKANLLEEGSFEVAMKGCDTVFHVASPVLMMDSYSAEEAEEKILKPAQKGTENVLNSVNKTESVQRVVLTSSVAAIYGKCTDPGVEKVFTEEDWNEDCSAAYLPYHYSKYLAEKKAWEIANGQSRWDMVVLNPSVIIGRPLGGNYLPESLEVLKLAMDGTLWPFTPRLSTGYVDVKDVAKAHCLAMLEPEAIGRYIVTESVYTMMDVAGWLREAFPNGKYPWAELPTWTRPVVLALLPLIGMKSDATEASIGRYLELANSKSKTGLGMTYTETKIAAKDCAEWMIENGHLKI